MVTEEPWVSAYIRKEHCVSVLEINFFVGSKYLLPRVKVCSKTNVLGSVQVVVRFKTKQNPIAKFSGHITAHLPSVQVVVRFKTKQNPISSKVLTMPLTIWNYV